MSINYYEMNVQFVALTSNAQPLMPEIPLPPHSETEMMGISEIANLFGITHRTLHFYEEKQLISPERSGIMRVYSAFDIHRLAVVNFCRDIGISVSDIQVFMQSIRNTACQALVNETFHSFIEIQKQSLIAKLSDINRQIMKIDALAAGTATTEDELSTLEDKPPVNLTKLEHRCLELIAEGYGTMRIARTLNMAFDELSEVENSINKKLEAGNRFEAVSKAVINDLLCH